MILFFSNSNIDTAEEYARRLAAARALAAAEGLELVADRYDHADWLEKVARGFETAPEKGARCQRCFRYNLSRAAAFAAARGCAAFTTSLTVSPHKPSALVFAAARAVRSEGENPVSVPFLEIDFKKRQGFLTSLARSRELGLYRQTYCGCEFSRR